MKQKQNAHWNKCNYNHNSRVNTQSKKAQRVKIKYEIIISRYTASNQSFIQQANERAKKTYATLYLERVKNRLTTTILQWSS